MARGMITSRPRLRSETRSGMWHVQDRHAMESHWVTPSCAANGQSDRPKLKLVPFVTLTSARKGPGRRQKVGNRWFFLSCRRFDTQPDMRDIGVATGHRSPAALGAGRLLWRRQMPGEKGAWAAESGRLSQCRHQPVASSGCKQLAPTLRDFVVALPKLLQFFGIMKN